MKNILAAKAESRKQLAVLLDPEKPFHPEMFANAQPDLIFVGGSTGSDTDSFIRKLKEQFSIFNFQFSIPIILFPGNISQFSPQADALLFLSVLSSDNPQLLTGNHIKVAAAVHQSGIESIPMGYILIDGGKQTSVAQATGSAPLPRTDIKRIVDTAIAAELLGKQLVYLEAGSGADIPVSPEIIAAVRKHISIPLIVGGGICSVEQMTAAYNAGADIVVIGNHFESHPDQLNSFIRNIPRYE